MVNKNNKENVTIIINILNILTMSALYIINIYLHYDDKQYFDYGVRGYIVLAVLYAFVLFCFYKLFGSFQLGIRRISDLALSNLLSLLFTDIIIYFVLGLIRGVLPGIIWHILLLLIQIVFGILFALMGNLIVRNNFPPKDTFVVCDNRKSTIRTIAKIKKYQIYEFNITAVWNYKNKSEEDILSEIDKHECVITCELPHDIKKQIIKKCYSKDLQVYDVPSITDVITQSSDVTNFIDTPLFKMNTIGPNEIEALLKRFVDIIGSLIFIIILSPIMLISALIIKLQDGGDVFFRQNRLTLNGKVFKLIKFRSMIMNAEPGGKAIKTVDNDSRITPFGRFMRACRIDELPQLFNILSGDMSFVGPRALRVEEYDENEDFPEFRFRLKVKAGLTGYAQVYGKYNTTFRDKLLLDIFYLENYSLVLDVKLLLMTCITVLRKEATEGFNNDEENIIDLQ